MKGLTESQETKTKNAEPPNSDHAQRTWVSKTKLKQQAIYTPRPCAATEGPVAEIEIEATAPSHSILVPCAFKTLVRDMQLTDPDLAAESQIGRRPEAGIGPQVG